MSDTKDSVNPGASDETQSSATVPQTPPQETSELADSELDKVSGGAMGSAVSEVVKNLGNALSDMARKG